MSPRILVLMLALLSLTVAGCRTSQSGYGSCCGQPSTLRAASVPVYANPGCNTCNQLPPPPVGTVVPSFGH